MRISQPRFARRLQSTLSARHCGLSRAIGLSLAIALGATLAAGCSDSSRKMSVKSVFPPRNSTGNDPGTQVWAEFSTAVRLDSVSTSTFSVTGELSGKATGTFTLTSDDRRVLFMPSQPFTDGEVVTVVITSGVRGQSGVKARKKKWVFTVAPGAGPTPPPQVASRSPQPNATHVARDSEVVIEFDRAMNPFSFSSATVRLSGSLSGLIPAQLGDIMTTGTRLVIAPDRDFLPGEHVTVLLGSGLESAEGGAFPGESYTFVAASDAPADVLTRGPDIDTGGRVVQVEAGDLDGDGRLDLVVRTDGDDAVKLFIATGKGEFDISGELPVGQTLLTIAVLDHDGDGRLDILAGTVDRVMIFRNVTPAPGGASFEPGVSFATGTGVHSIVAGDIDHENLATPDLVLDTASGLHVHLGGLDGPPEQIIGTARLSLTRLVLRDLDTDGFADLVYGDTEGNRISLRSFAPDVGFGAGESENLPSDAREIHVEDLTGDLEVELIALVPNLTSGGEDVLFLDLSGDTGGTPPGAIALPTMSASSMTLADLDGDGWIDLLLSNPELASIELHANDQGAFDAPAVLLDDEPVERLVAYDFTGDGVLDIIAAAGDGLLTLLSERGAPPVNHLAIAATSADRGARGVGVGVLLSNESVIEGYTVVVGFDSAVLQAADVDIAGTATGALVPEFAMPVIDNAAGFASYSVIFDFMPPLEDKALPPGLDQELLRLVFDVEADAPLGATTLAIPADPVGVPPLSTVLTSAGVGVPFTTSDATFTVLEPPPPVNTIAMGSAEGHMGAHGVPVNVLLTNEDMLDEYTVVVGFDASALTAIEARIDGTATGAVTPDLVESDIDNDAGLIGLHIAFDTTDPLGEKRLASGNDQVLFQIVFDVKETAAAGATTLAVSDAALGALGTTRLVSAGVEVAFDVAVGAFNVLEGPPPPRNVLSLDSAEASQGEVDVPVRVLLSNEDPVEAFTVFVGFPNDALLATDITFDGTVSADAEFTNRRVDFGSNHIGFDAIFEFMPPFEGKLLPPGTGQVLFRVLFDVPVDGTPGEHELAILETVDDDDTRLISGGVRVEFASVTGTFTVNEIPQNNPNKLVLKNVTVPPGVQDFPTSILLTTVEEVAAVTVVGSFDAANVDVTDFNTVGTVIEPLEPELVVSKIEPDAATPYFAYSAIFDVFPPFENRHIFPGTDKTLIFVIFGVPETTPEGTYDLKLANELGDPPLSNALVKPEGFNVFPEISGGIVTVKESIAPTFIRGDTNSSRKIDIADHIYLVNYVFRNGPKPPCIDAADVDDNGKIEVLDMVLILDYLFKATFTPPAPFPAPGLDPTPDGLTCEVGLDDDL